MKDRKLIILLIFIITVGAFFRFYNLNWDQGLILNPDELDVGTSVLQLSFPDQMHPHFFRYGPVSIYLAFFTRTAIQFFDSHLPLLLSQPSPWVLGRFYSALFATLTILVVYLISRFFLNQRWAVATALLTALTAGLIQQAHFTTPEANETFLLLLSLLFLLHFLKKPSLKNLIIASICFGLALATKVSAFIFAPTFATAIIITRFRPGEAGKTLPVLFLKGASLGILSLATISLSFFAASPYFFLDFPAYRSAIEFEQKVATGAFPIFYTRQFINTTPVVFQMEKIFPYALGPALLVTGWLGLLLALKSLKNKYLFLTLISFLLLFLPNAFLFVKWTRYMAPVMPFFALFSAYLLAKLYLYHQKLTLTLSGILIFLTIIWTLAFFSIYQQPDIRLSASDWLKSQVPPSSVFAVEGYNVVDLPLQDFERLSLDLYYLDDHPASKYTLASALEEADYFLVQSRRVFLNHQRLPRLYPATSKFYQALFSGQLGYKQIKEFNSFPRLSLLGVVLEIPDEKAEETWTVFDHPVIRVYQKQSRLSKEDYLQLFGSSL